jgi:hypothetical protein
MPMTHAPKFERRPAASLINLARHAVLPAAFLASLLAAVPAGASEEDCKAMVDALVAAAKTPYHSFTTMRIEYTAPVAEAQRKMNMPRAQESEAIFTGTAVYFRLPTGKWVDPKMSGETMLESVRSSGSTFANCERLADETIDGHALAVYSEHSEDAKHLVSVKLWIGGGLPIRSETDIGEGAATGEALAHQHVSTRSEYGEVKAPDFDK